MYKNRQKLRITPSIYAAIIAGLFGLTGSLIGLVTVQKENARLKLEIQRLTNRLDAQRLELTKSLEEATGKGKSIIDSSKITEAKLIGLQDVIKDFNATTLVNRYNSNDGWSGFESLPGKGEHSLQCAVDRFFLVWNENVDSMMKSGCSGVAMKVTGVHHNKDCN